MSSWAAWAQATSYKGKEGPLELRKRKVKVPTLKKERGEESHGSARERAGERGRGHTGSFSQGFLKAGILLGGLRVGGRCQ